MRPSTCCPRSHSQPCIGSHIIINSIDRVTRMSHAPSRETESCPDAALNREEGSAQPQSDPDSIGLTFRGNERNAGYGRLYRDLLGAPTAVRSLFKELIRASTEEITGRNPDYFSHFPVDVQPVSALAGSFQSLPAFEKFSTEELSLALVRGLQILEVLHVPVNLDSTHSDAISMMLLQSILDAYAATFGSIALKLSPVFEQSTGPRSTQVLSTASTSVVA